ncbi:MAG: carbonic anhydrase [Planctomycetota bacterium]|mgnify:CR=1 FL=1
MRLRSHFLFICWVFFGIFFAQESISEENLWTRLKAGNERFISGKLQEKSLREERLNLRESQHPYAIILTCADSRVSPELIFDESLGNLFVIRVAGNVTSAEVLGSIEYAAEHLHSSFLLVLGHEGCGAVKAALQKGKTTPWIESLLKQIRPALKKYTEKDLAKAIQSNVDLQIQRLGKSSILKELIAHHKFQVFGGVYAFQTGQVELLEPQPSLSEFLSKKTKKKHSPDTPPKKIRI